MLARVLMLGKVQGARVVLPADVFPLFLFKYLLNENCVPTWSDFVEYNAAEAAAVLGWLEGKWDPCVYSNFSIIEGKYVNKPISEENKHEFVSVLVKHELIGSRRGECDV